MQTFSIIALVMQLFIASQGQTPGSDIEVLSVSCERASRVTPPNLDPGFRSTQPSAANSGTANPRGLPPTPETEIEQRNSIDQRSRELNNVEARASRERAAGPPRDIYAYRIKLRNTGPKTIKLIFWDYEDIDPSDVKTSSAHTFGCAEKIKSNSTAVLKAFIASPPERVISAKSAGGQHDSKGIIDRVEYVDGSAWQRSGWELPNSAQVVRTNSSRCLEIH